MRRRYLGIAAALFFVFIGFAQERKKKYYNFRLEGEEVVFSHSYKYNLSPSTVKSRLSQLLTSQPSFVSLRSIPKGYELEISDLRIPMGAYKLKQDSILSAFDHMFTANVRVQFLTTGGYRVEVRKMVFTSKVISPLDFLEESKKRKTIEQQVLEKNGEGFRHTEPKVRRSLMLLHSDLVSLFRIPNSP
ncbi:MAG: hypothetical protein MI784_04015 [Cytophagales bacterium]|nr:hypothetical protein [Cytophagales bacterium]